jgi:hypothetical protein
VQHAGPRGDQVSAYKALSVDSTSVRSVTGPAARVSVTTG